MRDLGRPYPWDLERRKRVRFELVERNMTITELASKLGINRGNLTSIINGTRISKKNEEKIAAFFGKRREELFPVRSRGELRQMREADVSRGSAA
jgi:plasmid maintenance system antidote protein VapI